MIVFNPDFKKGYVKMVNFIFVKFYRIVCNSKTTSSGVR